MIKKQKISKQLEEQIQLLAGDIYIQIEDKIISLLNTLPSQDQSVVVADETVAQQQKEALNEITSLKSLYQQLENNNNVLKTELSTKSEEFSHSLLLKEVKLSNTEQTLNEKLSEIASLKNSLGNIIDKEQKNREQLFANNIELSKIENELAQAKQETVVLLQKDQENTATTAKQEYQIAELNKQLEQTKAEFKQMQAQKNQQTNRADRSIQQNQESIQDLTTQINELTEKLANTQQKLNQSIMQENQVNKQLLSQKALIKNTEKNFIQKEIMLQKTIDDYGNTIDILSENDQQQSDEIKYLTNKNADINRQNEKIKVTVKETSQQAEKTFNKLNATATEKEVLVKKQAEDFSLQLKVIVDQRTELENKYDKASQQLTEQQKNNKLLTSQHEKAMDALEQKFYILLKQNSEFQQQITTLTSQQKEDKIKQTQLNEKLILLEQQRQVLQKSLLDEQTKITQLQQQHDESFNEQSTTYRLATEKIQKDFDNIKNKLTHEEERRRSKSDKYEKDANNARDTIKYLRDENFELQTKLTQQADELEDKVTEYRLRFEYAQKQLSAQT